MAEKNGQIQLNLAMNGVAIFSQKDKYDRWQNKFLLWWFLICENACFVFNFWWLNQLSFHILLFIATTRFVYCTNSDDFFNLFLVCKGNIFERLGLIKMMRHFLSNKPKMSLVKTNGRKCFRSPLNRAGVCGLTISSWYEVRTSIKDGLERWRWDNSNAGWCHVPWACQKV